MYNYQKYIENDYFRNTTPNNMMNNQPNLYTPEEGYNKGNLFADLYVGYKNYQPARLQANNEKDALFLEMSRYAFAPEFCSNTTFKCQIKPFTIRFLLCQVFYIFVLYYLLLCGIIML